MRQFFYGYLRGHSALRNVRIVEVVEDRLKQVLAPAISCIEFDDEYYIREYSDVAEKLQSGELASAHDHYINDGYFEDRFPRSIQVDEQWYLKTYSDVADAVASGDIRSAKQHFIKSGFKEGRLPSEDWSLSGTKTS